MVLILGTKFWELKKKKKNEAIDDSVGHFASSIGTSNSTLNNI